MGRGSGVVVNVERVAFLLRIEVVWRGVVAGYTRISSQTLQANCAVICNLVKTRTHTNTAHTPASPHIWRRGRKWHVFGGDSLLFYSRHFPSARVLISADRGWRLRASNTSVRNARCLHARIIPRGELETKGRKGANGIGGRIRVGGGNRDGNEGGCKDGNGDGGGDPVTST